MQQNERQHMLQPVGLSFVQPVAQASACVLVSSSAARVTPRSRGIPLSVVILRADLVGRKNPRPDPNPVEPAAETRCHGPCPVYPEHIP
jgi:hypothetical protein